MNLKMKTESELRAGVCASRAQEKRFIIEVLHHLIEIESRRLELKWGFESIYDYCIKELSYTKDEAYYRIQAMRLLKSVPIVESEMLSGRVSLTTLVKTQVAFNNENKRRRSNKLKPLSQSEKIEVIEKVAKESLRDCEKVLVQQFPEVNPIIERTKRLSESRTSIQLSVDNTLLEKLEKLKDLLAHRSFNRSWEGLIAVMADITLDRVDPLAIQKRQEDRQVRALQQKNRVLKEKTKLEQNKRRENQTEQRKHQSKPIESEAVKKPAECAGAELVAHGGVSGRREFSVSYAVESARNVKQSHKRPGRKPIPLPVNRDVWISAESRCEFVDTQSKQRCTSTHGLQTDHRLPIAHGGGNEFENLRLLCGAHNRYEAERVLKRRWRKESAL